MKTMKDYFDMLTELEQKMCMSPDSPFTMLNKADMISYLLDNHFEELTLEEYSTLQNLLYQHEIVGVLGKIEYILAESNDIEVD